MKAAAVFIKALENEGVEYIWGVPGEENLDFLEALRTSKIKFIVTRHEQTAGFMAATYGRLTGKPGVALSTLGPGATNLVTPAAYAFLGGMPLMLITGQKPLKKSKQGSFQIINAVEMFTPITKKSKRIVFGDNIAASVREFFRIASEERPGPVHLELPEDVAAEEVSTDIFPVTQVRRPIAEAKAIARAVDKISAAKSPLLLIGAGANRKLTAKMLREFIDATGIPFFNTQMGKGVIDERHPLFLGTAALSANDYLHYAVDKADLIINVGHDVIEKPPFIMKKGGAEVIHLNFYSANIDSIYFPQLEVVGDIANAIWQIKEAIKPQSHWDFSYFLKVKAEIDKHIDERSNSDEFPIFPQRIVREVREALPEDGILTLDNGMYKLWFSRNYKAYFPNSLLLDNALATMGAGVAAGIVAAQLNPEKTVLTITGDGGFMMNSQELETAVRLGVKLTVLLLNDNGYGMIKWKQQGMDFPGFGLDYGNPDFVKYAESYGAKGYRLEKTADFKKLLVQVLAEPGVKLLEVPVDYRQNHLVFTQELANKPNFL